MEQKVFVALGMQYKQDPSIPYLIELKMYKSRAADDKSKGSSVLW